MLTTVTEIIAFMAAAAIIGVALGWVLRGRLGSEQQEISDLRAQLRVLKKAKRESEAASKAESAHSDTAVAAAGTAVDKGSVGGKQAATGSAGGKKAARRNSVRKSQAEREADQEAGKAAFAEVMARIGKDESEDNLTKIYGIGRKYAAMLNDLGMSSYSQIASLQGDDLKILAAALGVLDDRIETEDWVGSARKLVDQA